jgi:transposase
LGAIAVYLVEQQLLPWERACEVLPDLLGVRMSQGTLASLIARCAKQLEPIEVLIQEELKTAEVLHQDITPLFVCSVLRNS